MTPDEARRAWNLATHRRLHPEPGDDLKKLEDAEELARLKYLDAAMAANHKEH